MSGVVVIRKSTGLPVIEMFAGDPDIQRVNTELFTVVPVLEYLQTLNNMSHYTVELDNVMGHWRARVVKESTQCPAAKYMNTPISDSGEVPPMVVIHNTDAVIAAFRAASDRAAWVLDYVKSGQEYTPNSTFRAWLADQG